MNALSDPTSLKDRETVEFSEEPCVEHQHHFEMYESIEGMVIVGITNDDGEVLTQVHRNGPQMVLPYSRVEPGEDWIAVAKRRIAEVIDVDVNIDGIERVRLKHYSPEGDSTRRTSGYDVIVRASPVEGAHITEATMVDEENKWDLRWISKIPEDAAGGAVRDDIRLFCSP